ncbi:hypothetical protein BYT27DRAFT_6512653 [Phlegmacium glaucopus]|nr:hypothetical protein BYT27DRAFT_6512653 [Phlegmacium glaucopus]
MIHAKFPCTYTGFFSDAQLEDENPNLHPTRRASLFFIRLPHQNTLLFPFLSSRITAEEDAFGDDEASSDEGSDDDEFWDSGCRTKHPSLRCGSQAKSVDRFAILACFDVDPRRIRSSILEHETKSDEDWDDTSDYIENNLSTYTASEAVEPASPLVSSQNLGTEATSAPLDIKCVGTDPLTAELESLTLSDNEDAGISFDDDSLFAQYGALLPSDKLPEKYKRCHLKPTKRVSSPSNTQSSFPLGCYRVVDFLHTNDFSGIAPYSVTTTSSIFPTL